MTHCIRCRRPLKRPTLTGMGPVCARASTPVPDHERDLFGFDVQKATAAALYRLTVLIEVQTVEAQMAIQRAFRRARVELGVWSA